MALSINTVQLVFSSFTKIEMWNLLLVQQMALACDLFLIIFFFICKQHAVIILSKSSNYCIIQLNVSHTLTLSLCKEFQHAEQLFVTCFGSAIVKLVHFFILAKFFQIKLIKFWFQKTNFISTCNWTSFDVALKNDLLLISDLLSSKAQN